MTGYYDVVLGAIPLALIGITGAFTLFGLSLTTGVLVGAFTSIGVIGHAMFVNGPVDEVGEAVVDAAPSSTGVGNGGNGGNGSETQAAD